MAYSVLRQVHAKGPDLSSCSRLFSIACSDLEEEERGYLPLHPSLFPEIACLCSC